MPGFRPRNGCFPGRFRPGLSGGPARSPRPSRGCRFSARMGASGGSWGRSWGGLCQAILPFRPAISRSCPVMSRLLSGGPVFCAAFAVTGRVRAGTRG